MPGCFNHRLEYPLNEIERNVFMEEIAHGVDEDSRRLLPLKWLSQPLRAQLQVKSELVRVARDTAKSLSKRLGVAMPATRTNLHAPRHGVPRRFSPLDRRLL
jgi:hypothetical protein